MTLESFLCSPDVCGRCKQWWVERHFPSHPQGSVCIDCLKAPEDERSLQMIEQFRGALWRNQGDLSDRVLERLWTEIAGRYGDDG